MNKRVLSIIMVLFGLTPTLSYGQIPGDQLGSWYIYFWKAKLGDSPWGFQGDVQHRNWNILGDLEQLLIRGGVTYTPKNTDVLLTGGYANITTGEYGSGSRTIMEHRIYQEVLLPNTIGKFHFTHRFRYEQRFVENQDFRTRYRYNLFLNIPLKGKTIEVKSPYIALYNELFINGQRNISQNNTVELYDRNRFYAGLGYKLQKNLKFQLAVMKQTTNSWSKNQLQCSGHHSF